MSGTFWWMRDQAWATDPHWTQATHIAANKPNIRHCIEDIRDAGATDIWIVLGNVMPEKVWGFLGDGWKPGARFTFFFQWEPKGIARSVDCAKEFMGKDQFIVYPGDNLLKNGIKAIPEKMTNEKADCIIPFTPVK